MLYFTMGGFWEMMYYGILENKEKIHIAIQVHLSEKVSWVLRHPGSDWNRFLTINRNQLSRFSWSDNPYPSTRRPILSLTLKFFYSYRKEGEQLSQLSIYHHEYT